VKSALVANGWLGDSEWAKVELLTYDQIIAVDGGLNHCARLGFTPSQIVGDLDSIGPDLLAQYENVPLATYPTEKDETDLELALGYLPVGRADLFAAAGGRTDHLLAVLQLLAKEPGRLRLRTPLETSWVIEGDHEIKCPPGQKVSLMPIFEGAKGVTSRGLKWELEEMSLDENQVSLSNVCLGDGFTVSIGEGKLLLSLVLAA